MTDRGEVVVGEVEDRPLTAEEKQRISEGKPLAVGNGSYVPFNELPPETLAEYRARGIAARRRNMIAKKIGTLQGYLDAAREHAHTALSAKVIVMEGLLKEMEVVDPRTGETFHDTSLLDDKRLKRLQDAADAIEKAGGFSAPKKEERTVNVDVNHLIADLQKQLSR